MRDLSYILNACLFLIAGCAQVSQEKEDQQQIVEKNLDTLAIVEETNRYKLVIDSLKSGLDSLKEDIYESAEGGTLKIFYRDSDTLKKEIMYFGETGKRFINIYLKEDRPTLIEDIHNEYQEPIYSSSDGSIKNRIDNFYYLNNETNLIYWVKEDQVMPPALYLEHEKEIIKLSL